MADQSVQRYLESQVPELVALKAAGILSPDEVIEAAGRQLPPPV
jgi:hypothetical protein